MFTKKLLIITGASQNHHKSLQQFLTTVDFNRFDCIVFDLGLAPDTYSNIQARFPSAQYRVFDYAKYPTYYNININAGEYAWKPAIINEVLHEIKAGSSSVEILLWCDAGNKIINSSLYRIISATYTSKIYSPTSSGNIRRWTYPVSYRWFGISDDSTFLNHTNRNGAILAFNITDTNVCSLIERFAECASIKECIAPEGSSRQNHRQDQAVFTILYYQFFERCPYPREDRYLDISIHNDID